MRMSKKKVFVTALALCLVAILSLGTLAWFNAADEITNRFMIADSDGTGIPNFTVDVWETDPTDPTVKDQDGLVFEEIAPGDVLDKNPTVENTGDYDQWIRVLVTVDEYSKIKAGCINQGITEDVRTWLNVDATLWTAADAETVEDGDKITYVYYYNNKLAKDATVELFTTVTIPGELEQQDMGFASGDFSITVKAEALQADNTGDNAKDAFANYWGL